MSVDDEASEVLAVVTEMIDTLLGDYDLDDTEITMDTTFHDDLELESVDLVTLADMLMERYGPQVNLAEFFAEKDIDEVIAMTVGEVVNYVTACRAAAVGAQG
jgi:acyl carrier protein